jgi:hypothetical protein
MKNNDGIVTNKIHRIEKQGASFQNNNSKIIEIKNSIQKRI